MKKLSKFILIFLIIIILILIILFLQKNNFDNIQEIKPIINLESSSSSAISLSPSPSPSPTINFKKNGVVLNWDANTEKHLNSWIFLYEEPGQPTLTVKLIFDQDSVYDPILLKNGQEVYLEGIALKQEVKVLKLNQLEGAVP